MILSHEIFRKNHIKNSFDLIQKGVMLVAGDDSYVMKTRFLFSWTIQLHLVVGRGLWGRGVESENLHEGKDIWVGQKRFGGRKADSNERISAEAERLKSVDSVQFSRSVVSDSLWPMNSSTPGFPDHHQLPEFTITHAIKMVMPSSHLSSVVLFSTCPQSLPASESFQWVNSSHEVAKVLEFQLQHHSFQWTPRTDLLKNGLVGSPCSPRDSQESSPTPQFKSINSSGLSSLHSPTLTSIHDQWKTIALTRWTFVGKVMSLLLICSLGRS